MIGRLSGVIAEKTPPLVVIDVAGVGYEVDVPMSTFFNLGALGERTVLLTHLVVREDAHQLFGFLTASSATDRPDSRPSAIRGPMTTRPTSCRPWSRLATARRTPPPR